METCQREGGTGSRCVQERKGFVLDRGGSGATVHDATKTADCGED